MYTRCSVKRPKRSLFPAGRDGEKCPHLRHWSTSPEPAAMLGEQTLMSVVNRRGHSDMARRAGGNRVGFECELHRAGDGALETTVDQTLIRGLTTAVRVSSRGFSGI